MKEFRGERRAQDVENFLWKMDDYFDHENVVDEATKIRMALMYLSDTACCSGIGRKHTRRRELVPLMIGNSSRMN